MRRLSMQEMRGCVGGLAKKKVVSLTPKAKVKLLAVAINQTRL